MQEDMQLEMKFTWYVTSAWSSIGSIGPMAVVGACNQHMSFMQIIKFLSTLQYLMTVTSLNLLS
ncbi:hypothetical protein Fmac_018906 [Flemingia macrophylla]|uniref:Uncharacterized protein n=1 Tax=Flemingia macrophylla TaxID=520843 RepID=A0ABD1M8A9_9FABA